MILADKILFHRKKLALSQEELAEQLNVSRQSVSKWEGAQSIPDMDKIIKLSDIFSVSIDYLLRDEIQDIEYVDQKDHAGLKSVSLEESNAFIAASKQHAKKIALGVFLCITSPVLLVFLNALYEKGFQQISETTSNSVGLTVLIAMVAAGVGIFVKSGSTMKPYEYLKQEIFEPEYGVEGSVKKERDLNRNEHVKHISLGVVLLITSVIPGILSELVLSMPILHSAAPALFLLMVAIGVYLIIKTSIYNGSFAILLQQDDYTAGKKKSNPIYGKIAGIYWLCATTIYLAISFISGKWDKSWILWPIAGVLFGVISIIISLFVED